MSMSQTVVNFFLSRYWYADHAIPCGEPNSAMKGMARPS